MAEASVVCPECGTKNPMPEPGLRKITCASCGYIMVLKKILKEQPAPAVKAAAPAEPRPTKAPVIRRRSKAPEVEPASPKRVSEGSSRTRKSRSTGASRAARETEPVAGAEEEGRRYTTARRAHKPAMHPAIAIGSVVGFILVAGAIWFFLKGRGAGAETTEPVETAHRGQPSVARPEEPSIGDGAESGDESEVGDEATGSAAATANESPAAAKATPKKPDPKGPWWELDAFDTKAIASAKAEAINQDIETLKDLNATVAISRARDSLMEMRREAIPMLINALIAIDKGDKDGTMRGWQIIQVLQDCGGQRFQFDSFFRVIDWNDPGTKAGSDDVDCRRKAVKDWWTWWNKHKATWSPDEEEEG